MPDRIQSLQQFQERGLAGKPELFKPWTQAKRPKVLLITCSDFAADPALLTRTQPSELFALRTPGNIVPPYLPLPSSEAAAIEYAINHLRVEDIVICGHSHCGAMQALLYPDMLSHIPVMGSWLSYANTTQQVIQEKYGHLRCDETLLDATIEENVLIQLGHLKTHPAVAAKLSTGHLSLQGWVFDSETGAINIHDQERDEFIPLAQAKRWYPALKPAS